MRNRPKTPLELPSVDELRRLFEYDPATGVLRWRVRPHPKANKVQPGQPAGCMSHDGYITTIVGRKQLKVHRVIWCMVTGEWPPNEIDHINRNRSDNRWSNLRAATTSQNQANRDPASVAPHGLKGVHKTRSKRNPWWADIRFRGQRFYIGCYPTAELAHAAYCAKARELFGEFARV